MKVDLGKISTKYDTDQIDGGYYQAPKNSRWFNGIELGDYAFVTWWKQDSIVEG